MPTRQPDQTLKASLFQSLHQRPQAFLLPNPWDAGTTRLLTSLGFEAVATTSLGLANAITLDRLASIGVRRVSIGGALSRLALQRFLDGAREMLDGQFGFLRNMAGISELHERFQ